MKYLKNTKLWMRVFFVIMLISFVLMLQQWQQKHITEVKTVGGSFAEGMVGAPRFINPVLAREKSPSEKDLTQLIFGNLLTVNPDESLTFDLGKSLQVSKDKKQYTLEIKKNLQFHDGTPLTIDDVIFTIKKIQDPLIKSPLYLLWEGVEMEKIDSHTVLFTLIEPFSDFDHNLSLGVLPKHIWESINDEEFIFSYYNTHPIGSGHYELDKVRYQKTGIPVSYTLKKSKTSPAYISSIKLFFYDNEKELVEAYREGEINAAYGISAQQNHHDIFNNSFSTTGPLPQIFGLFFNQNKQTLLKDKNIRSIINQSIDRKNLVKKIFAGYAYPINSPLGNNIAHKNTLEKDIIALEKKGWKKNEHNFFTKTIHDKEQTLEFDISVVNDEKLIQTAKFIQAEIQKQGIKINLRFFDLNDFHQKVIRPRDYDILLFGYMLEKQTNLFAFWHSDQKEDPGLNISLYSNTKVNNELKKLRNNRNKADISKIESEIMNDIPAVFLYRPAFTYLLPKKIKGENIHIQEKHDRFNDIEDWYIRTRKVLDFFVKNN